MITVPARRQPGPGRPPIPHIEKKERAQRYAAASTSAQARHDPQKLAQAAAYAAGHSGQRGLESLLREVNKTPTRPTKMRKKLSSPLSGRFAGDEALAIVLDLSLSKEQYVQFRSLLSTKGAEVLPPYSAVAFAKSKLRPAKESYSFNDTVAELELAAILCNTTYRILDLQEDIFVNYLNESQDNECTLHCSWGFDGTTGMSIYKQKYETEEASGNSLFATTIIPLRLIILTSLLYLLNVYIILIRLINCL